jgi:hypothetical protein
MRAGLVGRPRAELLLCAPQPRRSSERFFFEKKNQKTFANAAL